MKNPGFQTILLGLVILLLVVSVGVMAFNIYKIAPATETGTKLWTDRKWWFLSPTIMNVMAMGVLAVLVITAS